MNKTSALVALAALTLLGACSAERVSNFPSYKLKVVQGNEPDPRAIASLQGGMSREQVRQLLGTPMLQDPFHTDRWDYTYQVSRNGVVQEVRNLTLTFQNDQLVKAEGNAIEHASKELQQRYGAQIQAAQQAQAQAQQNEAPAAAQPLWTPDQ